MIRLPSCPAPPSPDARARGVRQASLRVGRFLVAAAAVALVGCDDPGALPEDNRVIGNVLFGDDKGPRIPQTATAGIPLEITIWTVGNGGYRAADTEVAYSGRSAVVTPYDYMDPSVLTDDLRYMEHRTTVVFDDPGTAEIVLVFRTELGYPGRYGSEAYTVEVVR